MSDQIIPFPEAVMDLVRAQRRLVHHYGWTGLRFTLDGRLIGDLGEAIALEHFVLEPCKKRTNGVDALIPGTGRTVQIKASATGHGPTFSRGQGFADLLLFFSLDFDKGCATVTYNGLEAPVRRLLGTGPLLHSRRLNHNAVSELNAAPDGVDKVALKGVGEPQRAR
ncbi:MAG: hypothetical protein WA159_17960 [Variovorax sp.]